MINGLLAAAAQENALIAYCVIRLNLSIRVAPQQVHSLFDWSIGSKAENYDIGILQT